MKIMNEVAECMYYLFNGHLQIDGTMWDFVLSQSNDSIYIRAWEDSHFSIPKTVELDYSGRKSLCLVADAFMMMLDEKGIVYTANSGECYIRTMASKRLSGSDLWIFDGDKYS
jgi:hypothetical protein